MNLSIKFVLVEVNSVWSVPELIGKLYFGCKGVPNQKHQHQFQVCDAIQMFDAELNNIGLLMSFRMDYV